MMAWMILWKIVLITGISLFVGTVIYIIPTGMKDIMRFFKSLGDQDE
jgi:hypothetical protein